MLEVFHIENEEDNILDILDTMISNDPDASLAVNGVRQNIKACAEPSQLNSTKQETTTPEDPQSDSFPKSRRKRETNTVHTEGR
jgi:hypothetical protein